MHYNHQGPIEVDIHFVRIGNAPLNLNHALCELTQTQQQHALRLYGLNQLRYIKQRLALNRVLRQTTNLSRLQYVTTANGKPKLQDSDVQFNLSHCDDYLLLAVAKGIQLGVDLCLHKHNQAKINRLWRACFGLTHKDVTPRQFYARWAMLEACLKASGQGWHASPQSLDLIPEQISMAYPSRLKCGLVGQILPLPGEKNLKNSHLNLTAAICSSQTIDKFNYHIYQLE